MFLYGDTVVCVRIRDTATQVILRHQGGSYHPVEVRCVVVWIGHSGYILRPFGFCFSLRMSKELNVKLWKACRYGRVDEVQELIRRGADPNVCAHFSVSFLSAHSHLHHINTQPRALTLLLQHHMIVCKCSHCAVSVYTNPRRSCW